MCIIIIAGLPTMYEPLAVIVLVSALRAAGEDINKHRADASRNGAPYLTLQRDGSFKDVRSGDLRVGQVIKVLQNKVAYTSAHTMYHVNHILIIWLLHLYI
jgi:protein involved in temperature-dependent protein secretion